MTEFLEHFFLFSSWGTLLAMCVLGGIFTAIAMLKEKLSFSKRMFVGLVLGVGFGLAMQYFAGFPQEGVSKAKDIGLLWYSESYAWVNFLSTLFIKFLKLIVVPIVFIGILYVILNLKNEIKLASLFGRSLFWLLFTTGLASALAVVLGVHFGLGEGFGLKSEDKIKKIESLDQILIGLMPSNAFDSMAQNAVIGVVIFAMILAIGMRAVGDEHPFYRPLLQGVDFLHKAMMKLAMMVIDFMPYAIVVMITRVLMKYGIGAIYPAFSFVVLIYVCALGVFVIHGFVLMSHGLNPIVYFKKAFPALLMAFTSRSSVATLPVSIDVLEKKMGVSPMSASFVATLGTTIGANGCAGYFGGLVGVFAYQALGLEVGLVQGVMIVILSMVTSVGVAGIPGIAMMVASIVLTGLGMGEHFGIMGVILAIDPIMDMARTMSNVSGGMIASIAVDKGLKMLDEDKYHEADS